MPWLARSPFPLARLISRITVVMAIGFVPNSHADTGLRPAYKIEPKSDKVSAEPVARAAPQTEAPLRLEYALVTGVERLTQTTRELRAVVETMPGPNLPVAATPPSPPVHYATPLEETLARLNHVEKLIADITRIIQAMSITGGSVSNSATVTAIPALPNPVAAVAAPPPTNVPKSSPPPVPAPAPEADASASNAITRAIWLAVGGLIAAILAIYMRRRFLRSRPSRKELAAAIDAPSFRDDALELADVMTSMGYADGAVEALTQHIDTNPRQALMHWLKLLAVYRQTGKRVEFEKAAEEMHSTFNVKPDHWNGNDGIANRDATLENYPHITAQLEKLWPTPECNEYLLSLLADTRNGTRTGFPPAVAEEIALLLAMLRGVEEAPTP